MSVQGGRSAGSRAGTGMSDIITRTTSQLQSGFCHLHCALCFHVCALICTLCSKYMLKKSVFADIDIFFYMKSSDHLYDDSFFVDFISVMEKNQRYLELVFM